MSYTRRGGYNSGINSIGQRRTNFVPGGQQRQNQRGSNHVQQKQQKPPQKVQEQKPFQKEKQVEEKLEIPPQVENNEEIVKEQQLNEKVQPPATGQGGQGQTLQDVAMETLKQIDNEVKSEENVLTKGGDVSNKGDVLNKGGDVSNKGGDVPNKSGDVPKEKPFWIKKGGRISRAERVRRRNMRLKKVLQPKNALMVLNELVGQTDYVVKDTKTDYNQDIFNATLTIECESFTGSGKSKVAAKTAAAEMAIRAIILKRLRNPATNIFANQSNQSEDVNMDANSIKTEDDKMEEDQQNEEHHDDLSWSQIASFAIYKLLSNWDNEDGGNLIDLFSTINSNDGSIAPSPAPSLTNLQTPEPKPAKKLPENAAHLNPSMLLNQMYPHTKYEEVAKSGNGANIQFTISCTIDGKTFTGVGPNKKTAKRYAAFEACKTLLNIDYPTDVYCQKMQVD